jgi:hypothetical protein
MADVGKKHPIPYAEGPHYFVYAFEAAAPFFRSFHSFLNERDQAATYSSSTIFGFEESVQNYYYNGDYDNVYQWYNEIRQPNTWNPSTDDSFIETNFSAIGIIKTAKRASYNAFKKNDYTKQKFDGINGYFDLRADYLGAQVQPVDDQVVLTDAFHPGSDVVFRHKPDTALRGQHYLFVNVESGVALNGHRTLGYGHEHGDGMSFVIGAGERHACAGPSVLWI